MSDTYEVKRSSVVRLRASSLWALVCASLMLGACGDNCGAPPADSNADVGTDTDADVSNDIGTDAGTLNDADAGADIGSDASDDAGPTCTEFSGALNNEKTLSGCVHVTGDVTVRDGGHLIVEPGAELYFAEQTELLIEAGARFTADGTAEDGILLTGQQQVAGYWIGVLFEESNSIDNILNHVTLEYAGVADTRGALQVVDDWTTPEVPKIAIENTTIRQSAGPALVFWGYGTDVRSFVNNTLTESPVTAWAHINLAHVFDATGIYTGNTEDQILLWDDENVDGNTIEKDQTWKEIGVPFVVTQSLEYAAVALTIEPGVTVLFSENAGLVAKDGATLNAVGTEEAPIVFEGRRDIPGFWLGLVYANSASVDNVLEHVIIDDAGGDRTRWGVEDAAIGLAPIIENVSLTVNNLTIRDSAGWGIWLGTAFNQTTSLTGCADLMFESTASGDIGVEGGAVGTCPF